LIINITGAITEAKLIKNIKFKTWSHSFNLCLYIIL